MRVWIVSFEGPGFSEVAAVFGSRHKAAHFMAMSTGREVGNGHVSHMGDGTSYYKMESWVVQ